MSRMKGSFGNVVLHLGLHKTGTTFLQNYIFPNIKEYNYIDRSHFWHCGQFKNVIISDEGFSGYPHLLDNDGSVMFENAKFLKKVFPNAKIILCLRNKESWVKSLYSEYLKSGGIYSFNTFKLKFSNVWFNFDEYISLLKNLFDDVFICNFEDLKNHPNYFVHDICKFINVPIPKYKHTIVKKGFKSWQFDIAKNINRLLGKKLSYFLWRLIKN